MTTKDKPPHQFMARIPFDVRSIKLFLDNILFAVVGIVIRISPSSDHIAVTRDVKSYNFSDEL
jgi:hypothetical protein